MHRIVHVAADMTWEDFSVLYAGFFPTSDAAEQARLLAAEYERHTGNKPHGENTGLTQAATDTDTGKGGSVDATGSTGKRRHRSKPEH